METEYRKTGIEIAVPSCACCSAKLEEELSGTLGVPAGTVKLTVPVMARLFYDPRVVELRKVVQWLTWRGYEISVARLQYGIPLRPLLLPDVWKTRVKRLSEQLPGVVSASINFVRSVIEVDYVPALVRPSQIRDALISGKNGDLESKKLASIGENSTHTHNDRHDPEIACNDYSGFLASAKADLSRDRDHRQARSVTGHVCAAC